MAQKHALSFEHLNHPTTNYKHLNFIVITKGNLNSHSGYCQLRNQPTSAHTFQSFKSGVGKKIRVMSNPHSNIDPILPGH
jgi:hypothetical protein